MIFNNLLKQMPIKMKECENYPELAAFINKNLLHANTIDKTESVKLRR